MDCCQFCFDCISYQQNKTRNQQDKKRNQQDEERNRILAAQLAAQHRLAPVAVQMHATGNQANSQERQRTRAAIDFM